MWRATRTQYVQIEKVAGNRLPTRDRFPFEFRREPLSCPSRIRGSLIEAHMTNGLAGIERPLTLQSENAICAEPIERRGPSLALRKRPAVGKPELRPLISSIFDEGAIFTARDKTRAKLKTAAAGLRCLGLSLSKANCSPRCPTSTRLRPDDHRNHSDASVSSSADGAEGRYAGSKGLHDSACLMSVSISSRCCCS